MLPILIFNRVETEYGYPYTTYYNLIKINGENDINVDGEYYSYLLHNIEIDDKKEIKIHSSEEIKYDYSKISENISEGLYLFKNEDYLGYYDCENKKFNKFSEKTADKIDNMIKNLLIDKYMKNYNIIIKN
jgi:hypothetical protein